MPIGAVSCLHDLSGLQDMDPSSALLSHTVYLWDSRASVCAPLAAKALGVLAVAEKILTRGTHPLVSPRVEAAAIRRFGLSPRVTDLSLDGVEVGFAWKESDEPFADRLLNRRERFLPCDEVARQQSVIDTEYERQFVEWLTTLDSTLPHWLLPQVEIGALTADESIGVDARRVDFILYRPCSGPPIAVEIDGPEHDATIDANRDAALGAVGIRVFRISNAQMASGSGEAIETLHDYLRAQHWLATDHAVAPADDAAARLALACTWAAKLQLALVRGVRLGFLGAGADLWRLRVADPTDIADVAIQDLLELLEALQTLFGGSVLPNRLWLELDAQHQVFERSDGAWQQREAMPGEADNGVSPFVIHLQPFHGPYATYPVEPRPSVIVRPAPVPARLAQGHTPGSDALLDVVTPWEAAKPLLRTVLQWVFRKQDFREGQAQAIFNALRRVDSIVLLPTGGGKSIIYQLSGLLVPGICVVIDPIVALIEDQILGMKRYGMDRAIGISSTTGTADERRRLLQAAERGECQYILVAPERLQVPAFRDTLRALSSVSRINFAVIDEAHCVSEWGHDFRTSYLNLGRNLRRLGTANGSAPTLLALTGTASRAVLRDMLADLAIDTRTKDSLIRPSSFDRQELNFKIIHTNGRNRQADFRGALMALPGAFNLPAGSFWGPRGRRTMSGIVFTSFAKGRDAGVLALKQQLQDATRATAAVYSGGPPQEGMSARHWNDEKRRNATEFMENRVVALVATKAFGMGIDKPNVRFTIHYGMPGSLEGFYQEAGRAGRDRGRAQCIIVHSIDGDGAGRELLDPGLSLAQVRTALEAIPRNDRGDGGAALWFHLNSYAGADAEKQDVADCLSAVQRIGRAAQIRLPFPAEEKQKAKLEKAVFRLTQVGAFEDYEVDFGQRSFIVYAATPNIEQLRTRVLDYVHRSQPARRTDIARQLDGLKDTSGDEAVRAAAGVLIDFCYDTIERSRRRSIFEAMLAAKEGDATRFRKRLLDYLQEGVAPEALQRLVESDRVSFNDCATLLDKVNNPIEAAELRGMAIRFLESYPEHPSLLLLRGVCEVLCADADEAVAIQSLSGVFRSGVERYGLTFAETSSGAAMILRVAEAKLPELAAVLLVAVEDAEASGIRDGGSALRAYVLGRAREIAPQLTADLELISRVGRNARALHAGVRRLTA